MVRGTGEGPLGCGKEFPLHVGSVHMETHPVGVAALCPCTFLWLLAWGPLPVLEYPHREEAWQVQSGHAQSGLRKKKL